MIAESDIEKAVDYLRTSAQEAAQARANMKYLAEYLKSKKAELAVSYSEVTSNAAAENKALADPAYREVLDGYKEAVRHDAFHGFKREAAVAMIEAWRTQCSNQRAEGKIG